MGDETAGGQVTSVPRRYSCIFKTFMVTLVPLIEVYVIGCAVLLVLLPCRFVMMFAPWFRIPGIEVSVIGSAH